MAGLKNKDGFSISEVVVAVALVMLIAAMVLPAFIFSSETSSKAKFRVIAASLARKEAEEVKSLGTLATTVPYYQLSEAPQFGIERLVTIDSPEVGMNTVKIHVYEHPKDDKAPLASYTFYILRDGGV
ncbi:MAG: hypothetical protein QMD66_05625 [Actinomycetota bacterium]|nr:hypothetical protein [Actinomycetota bacterium]MDI6822318.1 hypothetical protein [Actinomycetota bacterium]